MAVPVGLAALPTLLGIGVQAQAGEAARATTEAGARGQADIEALRRDAAQKEFERQIARQQPFLDVGVEALPLLTRAISNAPIGADQPEVTGDDPFGVRRIMAAKRAAEVGVEDLPATQIQGDLIAEFLGEEAPEFIKERAMTNLGAVEAERRKGRLADLVSAGLGGALSTAGSGVDLGSTLSRSLAREGGIRGQALQESATARQNLINQAAGQLSGLPAFIAGAQGPGVTPTITNIPDSGPVFPTSAPIRPLTAFGGR